jgi:hypothetical protein
VGSCSKIHYYVAAPFLMPTYASHKCLPCDPGRSRVKLRHQLDQIEHIDHGYLNKKNQVTATFLLDFSVLLRCVYITVDSATDASQNGVTKIAQLLKAFPVF